MISNIFNQLTSTESILIMVFLMLAFVLGMICMWLLLRGKTLETRTESEE